MPDYVRAVYTSVKNTWQDAENLDETHGYTSYIWIPEETFKVDVLKLAVFAEKFRAYSKAALSKDLGTKTSGPSGGHSHSVSGVTTSSGGGVTRTTTYTTPSHTHDVVIGATTSAATGLFYHMAYKVDSVIAHDSGYLIGSYSGKDFPSTEHTHTVDFGTKTTESGGGSHRHSVTIPSHTHQVSGQTTSTVDDHTHNVPIGSHNHEIDFGIYEEDITGRTLSAKLYDPSGTLVKDFGVITSGEESVTLDLTSYFEELKYGFWRLELTASGRLRARLLYYELCKMYAQY